MMNSFQFKALILSYRTTPIEVRERVSLNENECKALLQQLRTIEALQDILVVSTCNRTEIYYNATQNQDAIILPILCQLKGISLDTYSQYFEHIFIADEAIRHLFEVAIGLDSQVVGDLQIANQVKHAYQWAADMGTAGTFLHRLMHTIFFTNKRVVQETNFRSGIASTSYAAVELAEEFSDLFLQPKILLIGTGEIGRDVFLNLLESNLEYISVSNRTRQKAEELTKNTRAIVLDYDDIHAHIAEADIIISTLSTPTPLITYRTLKNTNIDAFKYFIDLSVPRSVATDVEQIAGAVVYNIDMITAKVNEALSRRLAAIPDVRAIIGEAIYDFLDWSKEMEVSPVIQKMKQALEQIRLEELDRCMKELSSDESEKVERITKNIVQKILKLPVLQLKAACKRGEADSLIDVLNELFDLEKIPQKIRKS